MRVFYVKGFSEPNYSMFYSIMSIYAIEDFTNLPQELKVSEADKLEYGEIYTPFSFIRRMLDLFDPSVFTDPAKTWLDTGAGQGYFSMLVFERLNQGLLTLFPDALERKKHIVEKMLYMIELKASNVQALKRMFGEKANIIYADYCTYISIDDANTSTYAETKYFDYIIGNPPYNAHGMKKVPTNTARKKTEDGQTLWTQFIRKSLTLLQPTTGQMCMIVPALWLKPDKERTYQLLRAYKIEKIHCLSNTETNTVFKGAAQTPTCFFILTNTPSTNNCIQMYDKNRQAYVLFDQPVGKPLPLFGAHIIQKLQPWLRPTGPGPLKVQKSNMPSKKSRFIEMPYDQEYPYTNITTCVLEGLRPVLLMNYSDIPQAFQGQKKLVLAHKMYGFPYWDQLGHLGIANRDNYVIVGKTTAEFAQLAAFLSTKLALYIFEAARYRMKYLEKYAFEFIPDVTRLPGFPPAQDITEETVADYFGLDEDDKKHIQSLHRKNYERFL